MRSLYIRWLCSWMARTLSVAVPTELQNRTGLLRKAPVQLEAVLYAEIDAIDAREDLVDLVSSAGCFELPERMSSS